MVRFLATLLTAVSLLSFGGCAVNRATAIADPALRRDTVKTLHVKQLEGEDGSTKKLIAEKLAASGFSVTADPAPNPQAEAFSALVALGYKPPEVTRLLQKIDPSVTTTEELIRHALRAASG